MNTKRSKVMEVAKKKNCTNGHACCAHNSHTKTHFWPVKPLTHYLYYSV